LNIFTPLCTYPEHRTNRIRGGAGFYLIEPLLRVWASHSPALRPGRPWQPAQAPGAWRSIRRAFPRTTACPWRWSPAEASPPAPPGLPRRSENDRYHTQNRPVKQLGRGGQGEGGRSERKSAIAGLPDCGRGRLTALRVTAVTG